MECLAEDVVFRFVNGAVTPSEIPSIDEHLARCEECRGLVADLFGTRGGDEEDTTTMDGSGARDAPSSDGDEPLPGPGALVGRYVVSRPIGMGGMGVVYLATDPTLNRRLTLKLLRADRRAERDAQNELLHEAQAMAQLAHPNVVSVFDAGTFGDQVFLAMEFVEGSDLRSWLDEEPRAWQAILAVFVDAGRGLAAAHAVGLVHRDFKPSNVLLGTDGRARVTDFGLARAVRGDAAQHEDVQLRAAGPLTSPSPATTTGALKGTPAYMAPEQFSRARLDARTDQFSFCVALYEGLYRQSPFDRSDPQRHAEAVLAGTLTPTPRGVDVPDALRAIIVRGLAVAPAERHASMNELLAALEHARAEADASGSRPAPRRVSRAAWIASVLAIVVVGSVGSVLLLRAQPSTDAPAAPVLTSTADARPPGLQPAPSAERGPTAEASASLPATPSAAPRKAAGRPRTAPSKSASPARYDDAPMEPAFARKK
jgi:eukaryotic-like serine/threonine-protein kinase